MARLLPVAAFAQQLLLLLCVTCLLLVPIRLVSGEFDYDMGYRIGQGNFGEVFQARHRGTREEFICKTEVNTSTSLTREAHIYRQMEGQAGFAQMHWFGMLSEEKRGMVVTMLGKNLRYLQMDIVEGKFGVKTTVLLAYQMITRLEQLHKTARVVHRDIKPENFAMGLPGSAQQHTVYLIDFGESEPYVIRDTENHIKYRETDDFVGTRRYASPHAHQGVDQTRRDDLISLGYIFVFMLKGKLPWMGLSITDSEKDGPIFLKKNSTSIGELAQGLPVEFAQYLEHVLNLAFAEQPNYSYLRKLFKAYTLKHNYKDEIVLFDWEAQKQRRSSYSIFSDDLVGDAPAAAKTAAAAVKKEKEKKADSGRRRRR